MSTTLSEQTSNNSQSITQQIALLKKLSKNLWWSWNTDAQNIFAELSPRLWSKHNHSPIKVMSNLSEAELSATLAEKDYAEKVQRVLTRFEEYLTEKDTWAAKHAHEFNANPVAYFSAEFGLHESLPIYSGGLGILAGDHIKSASDLGLNFIGVTLYYREGYFQQHLSMEGWQQEEYPLHPAETLPMDLVVDENGKPITVAIELAHSIVHVCAWEIKVGRAKLYLLDTNLEENEGHYRDITCHVYGGDSTTRINQEIILGIGGTRFLHKLGVTPGVYHMNEGHSGFLTLELLRRELDSGKPFDEAMAAVKPQCVFTTHTPVPAGHDRFSRDLMDYSLGKFAETMKIDFETLMGLGKEFHDQQQNQFTMTVLCLNMSRAANGVSELNGVVAREMWQHLFQKNSPSEVPIGHITNGVHTKTWMRDRTESFWSRYTNGEQDFFSDPKHLAEILDQIPDEALWGLRYRLKRDLIEFVRYRFEHQMLRSGGDNGFWGSDMLSTDVLTIGFARRFATYKRAPLIFSDIERIASILGNSQKPVQIIFSGKAHPRDDEGKKFIQRIFQISKMPQFMGKVVFLENYDMNVARYLISGVDLWLNNPLRPLEASGTSGEKVIAHGGLNCSIMDGWWREGYNSENGWAIGKDENHPNTDEQSDLDAKMLYEILENDIVPTYYKRDRRNLPTEWLKKMRASILSLLPVYNTHRMVRDYCEKYYKSEK